MTAFENVRTEIVPRRLLEEQIGLALLVWAGYVAVIAGIIAGIAYFGTITGSVWEPATQAPPWYALFIGVYLMSSAMPMYLAHGLTRREFATQAVVFTVLFASVLAALMTVGFVLETILYRIMDWPQDVAEGRLFTSARQFHLIFIEYWLTFLIWLGVGAFIAAAWYRFDATGLLAIAPALIPISLAGIALSSRWGPADFIVERIGDPSSLPLVMAVIICIVSFLLILAMTWPIVRDIPIRNKSN